MAKGWSMGTGALSRQASLWSKQSCRHLSRTRPRRKPGGPEAKAGLQTAWARVAAGAGGWPRGCPAKHAEAGADGPCRGQRRRPLTRWGSMGLLHTRTADQPPQQEQLPGPGHLLRPPAPPADRACTAPGSRARPRSPGLAGGLEPEQLREGQVRPCRGRGSRWLWGSWPEAVERP